MVRDGTRTECDAAHVSRTQWRRPQPRRKNHARNIGRKGFPRNGPTTNPHVHQPRDESDSLRRTTRHELRRNTIHIHQTHVVHNTSTTAPPWSLPKMTMPQAWEDKTHKRTRKRQQSQTLQSSRKQEHTNQYTK